MPQAYLGSHLRIFTRHEQVRKHNNDVIIPAHGGQEPAGGTFALAGGVIHFYCPDGDSLPNNQYSFFRKWAGNRVYGSVTANPTAQCKDYVLSKKVGYHRSAAAASLGQRGIDRLVKEDPAGAASENRTNYKAIERLVDSGECPHDIVTIRNRSNAPEVLLSYVSGKLKQEGYGYGGHHCHFCRSGDGRRPWDVELGKYGDE